MSSDLQRMLEEQRSTNTPVSVKEKIIALFWKQVNSRVGGFVQWGVGGLLGWLFAHLAQLGYEVPTDMRTHFEQSCVGLGAFLVTSYIQNVQSKRAVELQKTLGGIPNDAWIDKATIARAAEIRRATVATDAEVQEFTQSTTNTSTP